MLVVECSGAAAMKPRSMLFETEMKFEVLQASPV